MSNIFISYKRESRDKAKSIAEFLATHGFDVWWDVELLAGDKYANEINAALNGANATLVLWTPLAANSDYVIAEASHSRERNILVPVLLENTQIPVPFNVLQSYDLTSWKGSSSDPLLNNLLNVINKITDVQTVKKKNRSEAEVEEILQNPEKEIIFWNSIVNREPPLITEYQLYIDTYGESGWFVDIARSRLKQARKDSTTSKLNLEKKHLLQKPNNNQYLKQIQNVTSILFFLMPIILILVNWDSIVREVISWQQKLSIVTNEPINSKEAELKKLAPINKGRETKKILTVEAKLESGSKERRLVELLDIDEQVLSDKNVKNLNYNAKEQRPSDKDKKETKYETEEQHQHVTTKFDGQRPSDNDEKETKYETEEQHQHITTKVDEQRPVDKLSAKKKIAGKKDEQNKIIIIGSF